MRPEAAGRVFRVIISATDPMLVIRLSAICSKPTEPKNQMRALLPVIASSLIVSCADDLCGNELIYSVPNFNGSKEAVVFVRNCGATTDYSTHVSVLSLDDNIPRDSGNTFIADSDHGAAITGSRNALELEIEWTDKSQLTITYSSKARVFKSENTLDEVEVVFKTGLPN